VSSYVHIEGVDQALEKLDKHLGQIRGRTREGLRAGGLVIQGEAQRRVPREYGDLFGSAFTRFSIEDDEVVEVGFGNSYALWVHENRKVNAGLPRPSGLGVFWGPAGEPGYLANAVSAKMQDVVRVVASYARVSA